MRFCIFDQILTAFQTAPSVATSGLENVEAANGWWISIIGILTVFTGLIVLVLIIQIFGKIFTKNEKVSKKDDKEDGEKKNNDEKNVDEKAALYNPKIVKVDSNDANPKKQSKFEQVKTAQSKVVEKNEPELTEEEKQKLEMELQETLAAIALAIHAELQLFNKEIVTNIDYPNEISSWSFSSRPVMNRHFESLSRKR